MATLSYNNGEWAEVYIFFKVIADRKLYTADAAFNPIKDVFLEVLSVIREEVEGQMYKYKTGDFVTILLNHDRATASNYGRGKDFTKVIL